MRRSANGQGCPRRLFAALAGLALVLSASPALGQNTADLTQMSLSEH